MTAQDKWKIEYRAMRQCHADGFHYDADEHRMYARERFRREAALERQIAAQQRRIVKLEERIESIESDIDEWENQNG